mgnify:CR=1 FL=1
MADISKIDTNFAVETSLREEGLKFYDSSDERFTLYGVFFENGLFRRLPESVAQSVSDGVYNLHIHTAGGRVKFVTNSPFVAIKAVMPDISKMSHFTLTASAGFDLYTGKREEYVASFIPPYDVTGGYEGIVHFGDTKQREITLNFPLYSSVSALYIGLDEDSSLKKASGYKHKKPIVFYGSSITQGGCASRPGNSYESIVSRALCSDYINLGFSGSAKAEDEMAEYIASLDMSAFVYDYDYNAPSVAHLKNTHGKMFSAIRKKNPDLPILILSRPKHRLTDEEKQRLEIIRKTYDSAVSSGDKNTYFIDGQTLMKYARNDATVDGYHPNDLGFYSMARAMIPQLKQMIK